MSRTTCSPAAPLPPDDAFGRMRWARTGSASRLTSSGMTKARPSSRASAWEARYRASGAQRPGLAVDRHLAVAHRLQQGGLGARGGPVDLVGEDDVGEDRAGLEDEGAGPLVEDAGAQQVAGEQVGGELDAVERAGEAAGQG